VFTGEVGEGLHPKRAGVSPEVVSKRLGHSSVVITLSLYAHVFEQDDQAAADLTAQAIYDP
jgi:integrase